MIIYGKKNLKNLMDSLMIPNVGVQVTQYFLLPIYKVIINYDGNINEVYKGIESVILDMLANYKNQETYTDPEWYRREGAIEVLENLLETLNE